MGAGDIFYLTLVVGYIGYCVGYHRGRKFAAAKDAKVLELGRWVASAIEGVRFRQRCGGRGIVTSSTGKAKLANGESYTVTVEMDRP